LDDRAGAPRRRREPARKLCRIPARLHEDDVRARVVRDALEVAQVRDHEGVARRGGELLDDPGDVEGNDVEAAARAVEHAQLQEIAGRERVVADRLARDEEPVRSRAEPREGLARGRAYEV